MFTFLYAIITQVIPFLPLAFAINVSYNILKATDMTLDGSFVLGAAIFARLVTLGFPPLVATLIALMGGGLAGMLTATIQRGGKVDPLLASILAVFILTSLNLILMGKPNINLLNTSTLFSAAFNVSDMLGWLLTAFYVITLCGAAFIFMRTHFGLALRAFGDHPTLLMRLGKSVEYYRLTGFAFTNVLAAAAGCVTAQTAGFADINMGFGMTLTGIGAIIIGKQLIGRFNKRPYFRVSFESLSCLVGITVYFAALNLLLRLDVDPLYLKMILGIILIIFLRTSIKQSIRQKGVGRQTS